MRSRNFVVLCCIAVLAACSPSGVAGNTDITLTIGPDLGAQDGEPAFEADRVDYRITCGGSGPGSAPIPPTSTGGTYDYDDSVDVSGAFEIVDADTTPVWYTVTDLPPGDCTATLSVYRDGAVVEPLPPNDPIMAFHP